MPEKVTSYSIIGVEGKFGQSDEAILKSVTSYDGCKPLESTGEVIAKCIDTQAVGEMLEDFKVMGDCLNKIMNDAMEIAGEDYDKFTSKEHWEKAMDLLKKMGWEK